MRRRSDIAGARDLCRHADNLRPAGISMTWQKSWWKSRPKSFRMHAVTKSMLRHHGNQENILVPSGGSACRRRKGLIFRGCVSQRGSCRGSRRRDERIRGNICFCWRRYVCGKVPSTLPLQCGEVRSLLRSGGFKNLSLQSVPDAARRSYAVGSDIS